MNNDVGYAFIQWLLISFVVVEIVLAAFLVGGLIWAAIKIKRGRKRR